MCDELFQLFRKTETRFGVHEHLFSINSGQLKEVVANCYLDEWCFQADIYPLTSGNGDGAQNPVVKNTLHFSWMFCLYSLCLARVGTVMVGAQYNGFPGLTRALKTKNWKVDMRTTLQQQDIALTRLTVTQASNPQIRFTRIGEGDQDSRPSHASGYDSRVLSARMRIVDDVLDVFIGKLGKCIGIREEIQNVLRNLVVERDYCV